MSRRRERHKEVIGDFYRRAREITHERLFGFVPKLSSRLIPGQWRRRGETTEQKKGSQSSSISHWRASLVHQH